MSDDTPALTYGLDEARKRLKNPAPSRSAFYGLIKSGVVEVSGYCGDRPIFTDEAIQQAAARLMTPRKPGRPKRQAQAPSGNPTDRPRRVRAGR